MDKQQRVVIVNQIIKEIAGRGRHFLSHDGIKDFIYLRKGKIFYMSAYLDSKGQYASKCLSVAERVRPLRLLMGGTLQALVRDFCEYIKGNDNADGSNGYGGLYCPHWGYPVEDMKAIQAKAVELGYCQLRKEGGEDE